MSNSLNLVFQYFIAAGAGVGLGLVMTIGGAVLLYNKLKGGGLPWKTKSKRN